MLSETKEKPFTQAERPFRRTHVPTASHFVAVNLDFPG
jgi:hypothetical protein